MIIGPTSSSNSPATAAGTDASQSPAPGTVSGGTAGSGGVDTVALSATSLSLQSASGTGDVNAAKVAQVKQQLDAGTFPIDAQKVAAKMMSDAAGLLEVLMGRSGTFSGGSGGQTPAARA